MKGLVIVHAHGAKGAEQGLRGGNGEDDGGVERLHEHPVMDQVTLGSARQAHRLAAIRRNRSKRELVPVQHLGLVMRIAPPLSVKVGEHRTTQPDLAVARGVADDADVCNQLGRLLNVSDFAQVDRIREPGGDGVALGVTRKVASTDARHGEEKNHRSGQDGGNHDGSGAGQRAREPLHGRDGAAAGAQARYHQRR